MANKYSKCETVKIELLIRHLVVRRAIFFHNQYISNILSVWKVYCLLHSWNGNQFFRWGVHSYSSLAADGNPSIWIMAMVSWNSHDKGNLNLWIIIVVLFGYSIYNYLSGASWKKRFLMPVPLRSWSWHYLAYVLHSLPQILKYEIDTKSLNVHSLPLFRELQHHVLPPRS